MIKTNWLNLRSDIESLYEHPCWEGFGLYIKTGIIYGFLDGNGDVVLDRLQDVARARQEFQSVKPKNPSDWCNYLNSQYGAGLDCDAFSVETVSEISLLDRIKKILGVLK